MKLKNYFLFALFSTTILLSCNKEDSIIEDSIIEEKSTLIIPDSVDVNVNNGILSFQSEEALQICINYLNEIGDDRLDDFEKQLGYTSYRSNYDTSLSANAVVEDDILGTLMSPEKQIIVAGYMLTTNLDDETTTITPSATSLKNARYSLNEEMTIGWNQNAFDIIETGNLTSSLKGVCGNTDRKYVWENGKGNPGFYSKLQAKVNFQRAGWYNSIIIKFKLVEHEVDALDYYMHYKTNNAWYKRKRRKTTHFKRENTHNYAGGKGNVISHRPYSGTRRVDKANVPVTFDFKGYGGQRKVVTSGSKTLTMSCT